MGDIAGGRTLDVTGFTDVIYAGHPIIKDDSTPAIYKPFPLNGINDGYGTLPANHTYAGILKASILKANPPQDFNQRKSKPQCNAIRCHSILAALKTALPLIDFRTDKQ